MPAGGRRPAGRRSRCPWPGALRRGGGRGAVCLQARHLPESALLSEGLAGVSLHRGRPPGPDAVLVLAGHRALLAHAHVVPAAVLGEATTRPCPLAASSLPFPPQAPGFSAPSQETPSVLTVSLCPSPGGWLAGEGQTDVSVADWPPDPSFSAWLHLPWPLWAPTPPAVSLPDPPLATLHRAPSLCSAQLPPRSVSPREASEVHPPPSFEDGLPSPAHSLQRPLAADLAVSPAMP